MPQPRQRAVAMMVAFGEPGTEQAMVDMIQEVARDLSRPDSVAHWDPEAPEVLAWGAKVDVLAVRSALPPVDAAKQLEELLLRFGHTRAGEIAPEVIVAAVELSDWMDDLLVGVGQAACSQSERLLGLVQRPAKVYAVKYSEASVMDALRDFRAQLETMLAD